MRVLLLFLLVGIGIARSATDSEEEPTPTPPVDKGVIFRVSLNGHGPEFHTGERIPITLSFSSKVKDHYHLDQATYDRSGRMDYEKFTVDPRDGAMDPLEKYFASSVFIGGGLTNFSVLSEEAWTIDLNLNEWLQFTKPGEYKLTVWSKRVEAIDVSGSSGKRPITSQSNVIKLKILPRDREWEKRTYNEAAETLKKAFPKDFEDGDSAASIAMDTLRYLGTADAAWEMVKQICGEGYGSSGCYFGLIATPERAAAREAFAQALSDPDALIRHDAISVLRHLEGHEDQEHWREDETKVLEKIVDALPNKKGAALCTTLYEVFSYATNNSEPTLPKETLRRLGNQLIALFDHLPADDQRSLLEYKWDDDQKADLLPLVKRLAQRDLSNVPPDEERVLTDLTKTAWQRWQELDPEGAQQALAEDMKQPHPRLTSLVKRSDTAPPESEQTLLEHFLAMNDFDPSSDLTEPIARYGTSAILPQVLKKFDSHQGLWDCSPEEDILAYILRVDPAAAKPRIEKALAQRSSRNSGCNLMLRDIAKFVYNTALEEIAIHELDDPNFEIAADAVQVLEEFGSPAAEASLWRRYESWAKSCEGHEEELNTAYNKEESNEEASKVGFGRSLFNALAKGRGWVADYPKLKRLLEMTKLRAVTSEAEKFMERWEKNPLQISIFSCAPNFDAHVCQYEFIRSIDTLKERLDQFPNKAAFSIWALDDSAQQCAQEIREFLTSKGRSVVANQPSPTP